MRLVFLAGLLMAPPAVANPFSAARYRGLMGSSTDVSGFSVYWNPAGLAQLDGGRVSLHAGGVRRFATYDRPADLNDEPPEAEGINTGRGSTTALGVVPSGAGGYGLQISEDFDLGFGAGFLIERAGLANWDRDPGASVEEPGAFDGPARWGTISTRLVILSPTAAIAARHRPTGISIGVAPVFNFVSLSLTKARNLDKSTTLRDINGNLVEGRILLEDATAFGLTWVVGARLDVDNDLAFAITWHQGADYEVEGTSFIQFGTADETTAGARFPLQVADSIRLGAEIGVTEWWTVRSEVEWANWSRMDNQTAINIDVRNDQGDFPELMRIERAFENTLAARLRSDFEVHEAVLITGGFEYETGATPEKTHEPGLAESDSYQIGVAGTFRLSDHLELTASFIWHQFADVSVDESIQVPTMNGDYTDARQYLTVDLEIIL